MEGHSDGCTAVLDTVCKKISKKLMNVERLVFFTSRISKDFEVSF